MDSSQSFKAEDSDLSQATVWNQNGTETFYGYFINCWVLNCLNWLRPKILNNNGPLWYFNITKFADPNPTQCFPPEGGLALAGSAPVGTGSPTSVSEGQSHSCVQTPLETHSKEGRKTKKVLILYTSTVSPQPLFKSRNNVLVKCFNDVLITQHPINTQTTLNMSDLFVHVHKTKHVCFIIS